MAICWERSVPFAFHLSYFYFSVVLIVGVPCRLVFRTGCRIRLYRLLIIAYLSTLVVSDWYMPVLMQQHTLILFAPSMLLSLLLMQSTEFVYHTDTLTHCNNITYLFDYWHLH